MCCDAPHSLQPAAPCTISIAMNRFTSVSDLVAAHSRPAGSIASRNGSATVAPNPFSAVRRDMCLPVMTSMLTPPDLFGRGAARQRSPASMSSSTTISTALIWKGALLTTSMMNDDIR